MPSDQSTWLIAIPNDGDADGLLPEITSKLTQASRSSQTAVTDFAIPAFKVDLSFSLLSTAQRLFRAGLADRHPRFPYHPLRGTPEAGHVLHLYGRQDGRHLAQPPQ